MMWHRKLEATVYMLTVLAHPVHLISTSSDRNNFGGRLPIIVWRQWLSTDEN